MKDVGMANVAYSYHWRVRTSNWPMFSLCTSSADYSESVGGLCLQWTIASINDRFIHFLRTKIPIALAKNGWLF